MSRGASNLHLISIVVGFALCTLHVWIILVYSISCCILGHFQIFMAISFMHGISPCCFYIQPRNVFLLKVVLTIKKSENHLLTVMKTISTLLWKKPFILFNEIIIHLLNCSHYSWRGILWNWSHFIMLLESFVIHKAFVDTMFFNTLKLNVFFVTKTFI
jgi:hypothetical protein